MAEVLSVQIQPEGQPYFSTSPLRRSSPSQPPVYIGSPSFSPRKQQFSPTQEELLTGSPPTSSITSNSSSHIDLTPPSSHVSGSGSLLSLNTSFEIDPDEDLAFPTYSTTTPTEDLEPPPSPCTDNSYTVPSPTSDSTPTNSPDNEKEQQKTVDDFSAKPEPSRHVDYLSHEWVEEDIWSSWRYIISKRSYYGERSREENASWRTWAKQKYKLRTIPPGSLNWMKECDVTWLYGPLQTATRYSISQPTSEPPSQLSKTNSFLTKKPILKKRSASEIMLQKSISTSSLVKQATDAIEAQRSGRNSRDRPLMIRAASDFARVPSDPASRDQIDYFSSRSTSGLQTPHGERKHIRFDDKVEQCIAVELKDGDDDEDESALHNDSDSSDDGVVMMKKSKRQRKPISRSSSRSSFSGESKTIAKLPSTTLKYRTDSPDVLPSHSVGQTSGWRPGRLSPSPSQETLRPVDPSKNFLIEDDDDDDISWDPSRAYSDRRDSGAVMSPTDGDLQKSSAGLRRTPSGMFMPYDDDEDSMVSGGILGRVVDTVNTARDIAHVIWNVGWRK